MVLRSPVLNVAGVIASWVHVISTGELSTIHQWHTGSSMAKSAPIPSADPRKWTRQTLPRAILLSSPDAAIRDEVLAVVRKAAFGADEGTWIVLHGKTAQNETDDLSPAVIMDEICTRPMFAPEGELKVVLVRTADFLLGTHHRTFLDQLDLIPNEAVLIFEVASLGKLKATNLFKEIGTRGGLIAIEGLVDEFGGTGALESQIMAHATALNLKLSHGALVALLNQSAKNLGVIEQELTKLNMTLRSANKGGTADNAVIAVSEQDIAELCATTAVVSPFTFANALMSGEVKQALEAAGGLFDRGIADSKKPGKLITRDDAILTIVLGAVSFKLIQLQDVRDALDSGRSENDVFKQARLYYDRATEARKALRLFDAARLRKAMSALFQAFMDIRRSSNEPRAILETLVFRINSK